MSINQVKSIAMTVADMDRSIEFYTTVLAFTKIADRQVIGVEAVDESCLSADRVPQATKIQLRVVELQLGNETIELTEFLTLKGRPIPSDSRSHDRWFQHIAIVVSDMDRAYQHLQQHRVSQTSPNPQTLPAWNAIAGGIQAMYFRDPDGRDLELIHFPPGKGDPKWQQPTDALFLGIDHTAIVVADTSASRAFYCDLLGMKLQQESENFGVEQELLSGVANAKVRISSLAAPTGLGIELLEYLEPIDGRPMPPDTESNDLWYCETTLVVADTMDTVDRLNTANFPLACAEVTPSDTSALEFDRDFLILDPDGHTIRLVDR
ncbi:VOC family protein [Chamaesiphon polymorphus]|nr:VOC family protein [Chamaesiphon polymorphus]